MSIDTASPNVTAHEAVYSILTQGDSSVSCAYVGFYEWGECFKPVQVIDEDTLTLNFGLPNNENYEHWFTAYSYLAYSKILWNVRAIDRNTAKNAGITLVDSDASDPNPVNLENPTVYTLDDEEPVVSFAINQKMAVYAKFPGTYGNRISIAVASDADFASVDIDEGISFENQFEFAPEANEFAIAVLFDGEIKEKHICSITPGNKDTNGNINYFETLLNNASAYINAVDNTEIDLNLSSFQVATLSGGVADAPAEVDIIAGYDEFENESEFDANIVIDGANNSVNIQQNIIDNVVEPRANMVAYLGPPKAEVVGVANISTVIDNLTAYVSETISRSSSYASFFGNYKLMFDHINGKDRWIPVTADMAGIYARTVVEKEPWYSGFGPVYGKMKNVKRLAINPKKAYRDTLYKGRVNPIYNDNEDGPLMFGQKTLLSANNPFNRLDIRFLFIFVKEAVKRTARQFMGEKNTGFQRRRYVNSITPFFEDVQGREGLGGGAEGETAFFIQCDEKNNPAQIRDQGAFVANHLMKPAHTIEFIDLTFTSVGGDVSFEEVVKG